MTFTSVTGGSARRTERHYSQSHILDRNETFVEMERKNLKNRGKCFGMAEGLYEITTCLCKPLGSDGPS